jgi:hypothetical protein
MSFYLLNEQWRTVAYLDGLQAKVNVLRELQSASDFIEDKGLR